MDILNKKVNEPDYPPVASAGQAGTTLGEDTEFNGTMKFGNSLKIEGKFQGDLSSPGHLIIGRSGEVRAEVKVGSVTVEGKLTGNIHAKELVDLRSTAEVFGDIKASKIKIEEGVVLLGKTEIKPPDSKSGPLNTGSQEKREFDKKPSQPEVKTPGAGSK